MMHTIYKHLLAVSLGGVMQFAPIRAVPEPANYALMLLGLCGLGMLCNRRRQVDQHLL